MLQYLPFQYCGDQYECCAIGEPSVFVHVGVLLRGGTADAGAGSSRKRQAGRSAERSSPRQSLPAHAPAPPPPVIASMGFSGTSAPPEYVMIPNSGRPYFSGSL